MPRRYINHDISLSGIQVREMAVFGFQCREDNKRWRRVTT
jgi:hypothetical protein